LWERPKLTALREAVRAREVNVIVAHALDRLSREQGHIYILDDECTRHAVALRFVTEEFEQTAVGKVIRSVKAFAAELEREKIRERSLRGKRSLAESGKLHNGGPELYGYRRDKVARTRAIEEPEAVVVRLIFRLVGEEHASVRAVTRRLNEDGMPPPSAGKASYRDADRAPRWVEAQVHRLLKNPAYKGEGYTWRFQGTKTNRDQYRPREEWLPLAEGTTPAIVSPALWQAAQDQLAANTGADTRNERDPYLLRGHIYCAVCGSRLYANGGRRRRVYRCSSRDKAGGPCGGTCVPADAIEARLWEQLSAAIRDPVLIYDQWQRAQASGPDPVLAEDRERITGQLARLARQQERLVRRLREAEDDETADLYEREIGQIGRERKGLTAALAQIDVRLAEQAETADQLGALVDYCARVGLHLADFDFDRKRLALRAFRIRVEANGVKDTDWHFTGSVPLG
jgi:site-specific DNA recombinase